MRQPTDSSLNRIKAWVHWVYQEKEPDEDRLLMAKDLEKLLAVAKALQGLCLQIDITGPGAIDAAFGLGDIEEAYFAGKKALEELEKE